MDEDFDGEVKLGADELEVDIRMGRFLHSRKMANYEFV